MSYYVVAMKHVTRPEHSKDGKRHVRTNYYGGSHPLGGFLGNVQMWGDKKDAKRFNTKYEAEHFAMYCGNEGCFVVEVK